MSKHFRKPWELFPPLPFLPSLPLPAGTSDINFVRYNISECRVKFLLMPDHFCIVSIQPYPPSLPSFLPSFLRPSLPPPPCPLALPLLQKGSGYHLDMLIVGVLIFVHSLLGLPWVVGATVRSITHVQSLFRYSPTAAPGERPKFLGVWYVHVRVCMCRLQVCIIM